VITILYFGKYSKLKEEHISLIQERDRLKGIIEEQSQRLSSLKGEYDFACKEVKRLANALRLEIVTLARGATDVSIRWRLL